jgi:transposase
MDEFLDPALRVESAHTTGRRSARSARVEVITRGERRRSWTPEQKREIVAESLGPELTPTEVARKHGISTGQLYTWRHQMLRLVGDAGPRSAPRFAEIALAPMAVAASAAPSVGEPPRTAPSTPEHSGGTIEIMLPGGVSLRVDGQVDGAALRRVLKALDGR